ncbi:hypothetical protein ACTFIU_001381 [Dictyostelium citrinum]
MHLTTKRFFYALDIIRDVLGGVDFKLKVSKEKIIEITATKTTTTTTTTETEIPKQAFDIVSRNKSIEKLLDGQGLEPLSINTILVSDSLSIADKGSIISKKQNEVNVYKQITYEFWKNETKLEDDEFNLKQTTQPHQIQK